MLSDTLTGQGASSAFWNYYSVPQILYLIRLEGTTALRIPLLRFFGMILIKNYVLFQKYKKMSTSASSDEDHEENENEADKVWISMKRNNYSILSLNHRRAKQPRAEYIIFYIFELFSWNTIE